MSEVLSKSADARKLALSLKNVEYGGELNDKLMACSQKLETLHEKINDLISRNIDDDEQFLKLMAISEEKMKWYEKAKAEFLFKMNYVVPSHCEDKDIELVM